MKTNSLIQFTGRGKSRFFLLTFLLWIAGTMSLHAEDYGFWVGSVKVTSSNRNDIKGGNIKSGTVKYNPYTNVLTLTNVYIYAQGSGGDVIHNKNCYELKVEFYGDNDLNAMDDYAIWCERRTYFTVKNGSTSIFNNKSDKSCVYLQAYAEFCAENGAELDIQANKHYAIQGHTNDISLTLSGGNITIDGAKGCLYTLNEVSVKNIGGVSDVTLYRTNNSNYPIVSNVKNMNDLNYYTASNGIPLIVTPAYAQFKNYSICDKSGNPIYASDIKINNDYVVPLGYYYFPDSGFANYWIDRFGSNVLKQSHINSITSLDLSYKYFFSLNGIEYFKKLQTLNCSYNRLDYLDLRDNPALTTLTCNYSQLEQLYMGNTVTTVDCSNNGITSLNIGNSVKTLDCSHNQLTSLNAGSSLKKLDCSYNKLTMNSINGSTIEEITCTNNLYTNLYFNSNSSSLKKLDCRNNPELKEIIINNTPTLTQFYVSGCSKLETLMLLNSPVQQLDVSGCSNLLGLDCSQNQLTSISGLSGCSALGALTCYGNKLTSITGLSGKTTLKKVDCHSNLLQSLDVSGTSNLAELNCSRNSLTGLTLTNCLQLKQLDCTDNQLGFLNLSNLYSLQKVDCSYNKLTAINTYRCDNLYELICKNNYFSALNLSDCTYLNKLDCKMQSNLTSLNLENCWRLGELDCSYNKLTTLNLEGNYNLKTLYCYYNRLTSINMPQSSSLQTVWCFLNELKGPAMDAIVAALPNRSNTSTVGTFVAVYTGSVLTEGNVCTTKNVSDANAKYWSTYQFDDYGNILPYAGASIPTDIQMAEMDIDDDAPRYNLSGQRVGPDYKGVVIINGNKKLMK